MGPKAAGAQSSPGGFAAAGLALLALALIPAGASGQDAPEWFERTTLSGLAFGDYYYVADHHRDELEGRNGFWVRRAYVTLESELAEEVDFRIRFEARSPGDYESASAMEPFVKDLYVRWGGLPDGIGDLYVGLSMTPLLNVLEPFWGYRAVEKTAVDLQQLGGSRDFGVALRGTYGDGDRGWYHVQVGNGAGTGGEVDEGKQVAGSVGYRFGSGLLVEGYADYEDRPGSAERTTLQAFGGWEGEGGRAGLQFVHQHRTSEADGDRDLELVSAFGVLEVSERLDLLARYDRMLDPNPTGESIDYLPFSERAESNLVIAGVDYAVADRFHVIPNLELVTYDDPVEGTGPDSDLLLRTTFSVTF